MPEQSNNGIHAVSRSVDLEFFQREVNGFLPAYVFDAHCHIWMEQEVPFRVPGVSGDIGTKEYLSLITDLHRGRKTGAMFLGFASPLSPDGRHRMNEFVGNQTKFGSAFRGEFFIRPEDDPEWVRQEVRRLGLHGLKCYHTFAATRPTWEAEIPAFLPEALIKVAHEEGWVITLHIVKSRAVADPSNIYWIRRCCQMYPNMRLILAHSARGFQPAHNLEGLEQLTGIANHQVHRSRSPTCTIASTINSKA